MIELKTLGVVDLRRETGEEYRSVLAQKKRLALLTYLVVARPRGFHRREALLPIFWPDMTPRRARHALRQSLHFLRQALGREAIVTRGGEEIGVASDRFDCDAVRFEQHVAAREWEDAVDLYNGPMLKGVIVRQSPDFDRWLDAERRRLSDLYIKALDGLLAAKETDPAQSVQWLRLRAEHDPFDPDITLRLMRALEAVHDRPGAVDQARAYKELVKNELGREPDPRVTALAERLSSRGEPIIEAGRASMRPGRARSVIKAVSRKEFRRFGSWVVVAILVAVVVFAFAQRDAASKVEVDIAATPARSTMIVTPFKSLSDEAGDYLADGITQGVLNRLAGVSSLRVVGWVKDTAPLVTASMENQTALSGALVLQASVQRDDVGGDSSVVRIIASVTRPRDGVVLWRGTFDRQFTEVPLLERDVASEIIAALAIPTLVAERSWLQAASTENAAAYDHYLRGMAALERRGWIGRGWTGFGLNVDFALATEHFEAAVRLDSSFAQPLARLAIVNTSVFHWRYDRTEARLERAHAAMERAIQLRPDLQSTHLAAAWYYYLGRLNYNRALRHLQMAQSPWAGKAEAMLLTAAIRRRQGEVRHAIEQYRAAEAEAGVCPDCRAEMAYSYYVLGDVPHAEEAILEALELSPDLHLPRHVSALIQLTEFGDIEGAGRILHPLTPDTDDILHLATSRWSPLVRILGGRWEQALDRLTLDRVRSDTTGFLLAKADLAERRGQMLLARAYYDSARVMIENVLDEVGDNASVRSDLGLAYAGLGRKAEAIREGKAAVRLRSSGSDVIDGPMFQEALAAIYMKVGEHDAAVRQLEDMLDYPGWLTPALLRMDPRWRRLRPHPRFRRLIAKGRPT